MFSSAFLGIFFLRTVCLGSFVFPGAFSAFFLGRIGDILLSPCVVARLACVGRFVCGFSVFFFRCASYVPFALGSRSANLIPAPSASALLFSGVFVAVFRRLFRVPHIAFGRGCGRSGPRFSSVQPGLRCCIPCREPHCPFSGMALPLFLALFPAFVSSSALDVASLFSSAVGALGLPPFCVSLRRCFCRPGLLLGPFWLGGLGLQLLRHVFLA